MATGELGRTVAAGAAPMRRMALMWLVGIAARLLLPFPWNGVALLPFAYGIAEGVRAMRQMRSGGTGVALQVWMAVGVTLLVMMTLTLLLPFVTFSSSMEYQSCLQGANTGVARAQCRQSMLGQLGIL